MRAFHFLSCKHALAAIEQQRIKVSRLDDLNDPFELYAMQLKGKGHRRTFKAWKNHMAEITGLLCFSKSWHSPLLWSHYADRHRGVALEFELSEKYVHEVTYEPERLALDIDKKLVAGGLTKREINRLLTTKFEHWKYEDEVRIFVKPSECVEEGKFWYYPVDASVKLVGIVHGPLCQLTEREIAKRLPKGARLKLVKARLAFTSFNVVHDRRVRERTILGTVQQ
jgi:hypothetical protein